MFDNFNHFCFPKTRVNETKLEMAKQNIFDDEFLDEFKRINPDTGKPFKKGDPRPQKGAFIPEWEIFRAKKQKREPRRMVHLDSVKYQRSDGVWSTKRKAYPCDDGKVFWKYWNGKQKGSDDLTLDAWGFYQERWVIPVITTCQYRNCGAEFVSYGIGGTVLTLCEKHRPVRRRGTPEEWKAENRVQCCAKEEIRNRTGCSGWKEWDQFYHYEDGRVAGSCFKCDSERGWVSHLRKKYGITPDDYDRQLEKQGGKCAICGGDQIITLSDMVLKDGTVKTYETMRLYVDHDHEFDEDKDKQFNRGIICLRCNDLIGDRGLKEDLDYAQKIFNYLVRGKVTKELMAQNPKMYKEPFPMVEEQDEPTN